MMLVVVGDDDDNGDGKSKTIAKDDVFGVSDDKLNSNGKFVLFYFQTSFSFFLLQKLISLLPSQKTTKSKIDKFYRYKSVTRTAVIIRCRVAFNYTIRR